MSGRTMRCTYRALSHDGACVIACERPATMSLVATRSDGTRLMMDRRCEDHATADALSRWAEHTGWRGQWVPIPACQTSTFLLAFQPWKR